MAGRAGRAGDSSPAWLLQRMWHAMDVTAAALAGNLQDYCFTAHGTGQRVREGLMSGRG